MISVLSIGRYKIIINEKTGKWIGFKDKQKLQQKNYKITSLEQLQEVLNNTNYNCLTEKFFYLLTKAETLNKFENSKFQYLLLHCSDRCNMNCKYCYAKDNNINNENLIMSSKVMIDSIDYFYKNQPLQVLFHGKEPLTNYENILTTIEHYKDNKNIKFSLQTNGLLLDERKLAKLKNLNVDISLSMDGISNHSNALRINKNRNLNYTKKILNLICSDKDINTITILNRNNYKSIFKIRKLLLKTGHESAAFNLLYPTRENKELNRSVVDNRKLFKIMKKFFESSIEYSKDCEFNFIERELYLLYGRVVFGDIDNYMCSGSPCGAGKTCVCVNQSGDVYACTIVNGQEENKLGNIYKDSYDNLRNSKFTLAQRKQSKIIGCADCPLFKLCNGGSCAGLIYNQKKNENERSIYCNYYKNMILYMMKKAINSMNGKAFTNIRRKDYEK